MAEQQTITPSTEYLSVAAHCDALAERATNQTERPPVAPAGHPGMFQRLNVCWSPAHRSLGAA